MIARHTLALLTARGAERPSPSVPDTGQTESTRLSAGRRAPSAWRGLNETREATYETSVDRRVARRRSRREHDETGARWGWWGWGLGAFAIGALIGAALCRPAYAYYYPGYSYYPAYGYGYYGYGYPAYYGSYYRPYYCAYYRPYYAGYYRPYYGYRVARRVAYRYR